MRLDVREAAIKEGAFVPGKSAESEMIKRLFSADRDEVMPPPKSNRHVTKEQKELLKRWIDEGANYSPHWAFVAPVRPAEPAVKNAAWVRNSVDRFILQKLDAAGLAPSAEASRQTLIRRLSLDLVGLPPKPEDVAAFLADKSPDAYEKLVERFLASPHYGERMALPWLDAARYADSNGFQQDGDTHQYIWRDWVVNALNADMPFDRFSIEQLAGDLLPSPTEEQLIATAFNRNHLLNGEGGAIPEEQRNVILFDRMDTTATNWLGLTMACAQCHDHKYDPITHRDYYSMMAMFNNVPESGTPSGGGQYRIADPAIPVGSAEQKEKLKSLEVAAADAKKAASEAEKSPETIAAFESAEKALLDDKPIEWTVLVPEKLASTGDAKLSVQEDQSIYAEGPSPDKANYTIEFPAGAAPTTGFRIETIPDRRLPKKGAGRGDSGNAVLTKLRVKAGEKEIKLNAASATHSQPGFSAQAVIDDDPKSAWAFYPETAKPYILIVQCAEPVAGKVELVLEFQSDHKQHTLGRFRVSSTSAAQPATRKALPDDIAAIVEKPERTKDDAKKLRDHVSKNAAPSPLVAARDKTKAADKALADLKQVLPRVMVMSDVKPRKTHVLSRGEYLSPAEEVAMNTPSFLPALPADAPRNRLGFARWLFQPEHPLTARVQMNRTWQYFFGVGIVKTVEDLGVQSAVPEHQELLNWLAVEFRERGWSQKHIVRLIVNSATYRQSSRVSKEHLARDPENRLFARAARFREPSLVLRDVALSASGLLDLKMGGKPVYPYQPDSVWETLAITKERDFTYPASKGADLYRRSIYTFWRRTIGPVNMFDASTRQVCKVRGGTTSTPLHALTTLNDPTWAEAARVLAQRAIESAPDAASRAAWAFSRVLGRGPKPEQLAILSRAYEKQLVIYKQSPKDAEQAVSVGAAPRAKNLDHAEHAAMTAVCLAILNLDQSLTRE